jgi:hypothetical protein
MTPDGILFVDEYVGPNHYQYDARTRGLINDLVASGLALAGALVRQTAVQKRINRIRSGDRNRSEVSHGALAVGGQVTVLQVDGQRSVTVGHVGNIARWVGRRLTRDPVSERFTNIDRANGHLVRERRKGHDLPKT